MDERTAIRREAQRLGKLVVRAATLLGIAAATITPAGFLALSMRYETAELQLAVDQRAIAVSQHVYRTGNTWPFDVLRLAELIEPGRWATIPTRYRIEQQLGDTWKLVTERGQEPGWPRITSTATIADGDAVVARLVGQEEVMQVLLRMLIVAIGSSALGFGIFGLVRFLAMPALEASFLRLAARDEQIAAHRAELERMVAERTGSLSDSNEQLSRSLTELQASELQNRRLALIAQRTDSAILITGIDGLIEWVNPAFTELTGYSLDELIGRRPGELLHGPETDPETIRTMTAARAAGCGFEVELLNYHKSGSKHWVEISCTVVRDDQGVIQNYISVEHDITLRKQQEQRLAAALEHEREVTQQQRRFVSVVAHEFRTPLTIIDGAAQRLARNAANIAPADLRERTDKIRAAVSRMGQLVETSLNAARLDAGAIQPTLVEFDLSQMLGTLCERIRGIATDFDLRIEGLETAIPIIGDKGLLDQVFTNLLTNAVKYSGTSKRIDMTCAINASTVAIAIRDYGIGVAEDEVPKLFTRFYRASTARGLPGTGIGLNLARELVALHKGELTVSSRIGEGSIFTVSLPRPMPSAAAQSPQAA